MKSCPPLFAELRLEFGFGVLRVFFRRNLNDFFLFCSCGVIGFGAGVGPCCCGKFGSGPTTDTVRSCGGSMARSTAAEYSAFELLLGL